MLRAEEFYGQAALPEAIAAVVDNNGLDLTVVRGFITEPEILDTLANAGAPQDYYPALEDLYEAAPALKEADRMITERWSVAGYAGMQVTRGVMLDQVRRQGIPPHLDGLRFGKRVVEAIAQGSLALSGERLFSAEKLPVRFFTDDRELDTAAYKGYWNIKSPLGRQVYDDGRWPRTEVTVNAGDLALFAHHPAITLHAVRHDEGMQSTARLLTWSAEKIDG